MKTAVRFLCSLSASVLCCAVLLSALPTGGEEELYSRVVRLHVLADSDTPEDQALKLCVRDAVLSRLAVPSASVSTAAEAEALYRTMLPEIRETAVQTLRKHHCTDAVTVSLSPEPYPARTYGPYTFPAGTYHSLRVRIGKASGHNWWCVLFPPLCLSLASEPSATRLPDGRLTVLSESDELLLASGFTPYELSLISGAEPKKTVVKFRIAEFFRSLFS